MSDLNALYDAATALKNQGDLPGAVAKLQEILEQDPGYVLAHTALAVHLQKLGNPQQALAHAKKVVELEPNDPFSHAQLSVIAQRCGMIMEAEDALARSNQMGSGGCGSH
ncbi:MAG: tetratricopeptide repeat protein [Planctomycetaceae bacterium]|nr:tetratricopeptide repeat protein [Planctomycetaceae bacterium]